MDTRTTTYISCLLLASCLVLIDAIPSGDVSSESQRGNGEERRATWLETRNIEENFKDLVYSSLKQLASEGLINTEVIGGQQADKRGRHQGFCFRKTKSGRFLPYICWKGEGEQED